MTKQASPHAQSHKTEPYVLPLIPKPTILERERQAQKLTPVTNPTGHHVLRLQLERTLRRPASSPRVQLLHYPLSSLVSSPLYFPTFPSPFPILSSLLIPLSLPPAHPLPRSKNISSLTPVPGTVCWLHASRNCSDACRSPSGCSKIVEFPGYADLRTYGSPPWDKRVGSLTCGVRSGDLYT